MARIFTKFARSAAEITCAEAAPVIGKLYENDKDRIPFEKALGKEPLEKLYDTRTLITVAEYQTV